MQALCRVLVNLFHQLKRLPSGYLRCETQLFVAQDYAYYTAFRSAVSLSAIRIATFQDLLDE